MAEIETEKQIIIKHVPSQARVYEIAEEEKKKDNSNVVKCPTTRLNVLELRDKIIHFVIWYDLKEMWKYISGYLRDGEHDFSEIDKEFEYMKKLVHLRKSLFKDK